MGDTLYIVMPAYNEEANIREVVAEWYPILENGSEDSRMVISDGGSKDKTLEVLYELQKQYEKLVVIPKPGTDHGTKVILLYRYAIEHGADWIFQTDSDGQTVPAEFAAFWKLREKYDVIMGDRKKRGDGMGRKVVENVLRVYLKIFFGTFSKYHEKVCYRTVTFQPRQGGKNYMNVRRIFQIGMQSIRNFAEIRKRMKSFDSKRA